MSDWKDTIRAIAPTIASALGGPLAGSAASAVGSLLGMSNATVMDVSGAIEACQITPSAISKLKELEIQYQAEERERGFRYADLEVKDRADARGMLTATKSLTPSILSYLITAGFFGILIFMMTTEAKASESLLVMLGSLTTAWSAVCGFWFGSSHGSAQKSELLAQSKLS